MEQHLVHGSADDFEPRHVSQGAFVHSKRIVTPKAGHQLHVSFMEIPPAKSAYPMHFHDGITEAYVILSGRGTVRTSEGEIAIGPGEVIVFPPGPAGAHRMTNTSEDAPLRYVDLDTTQAHDVVHYPDSGKTAHVTEAGAVAVWRDGDAVDYYDGELDAG